MLAGGFYCRRRLSGLQVLITVKQVDALPAKPRRAATKTKTPAGPVHRREEFEVELAADSPPDTWPESLARDKVLALSGGAPLVELFELQQDRTKRLVGAAENPVAELSLDVVRLRSGVGGALPAAGTPGVALLEGRAYFEVEVELLEGGSETDLVAIAGELQMAWALEPETRSKFERALEVLGEGSSAAAAGTGTTQPSEATASLAAGPLAPEVAVENAAEAAATEAAAEEDRDLIPVREAEDDAVDEAEETLRLKVGKRKCKRARDTFLGDGLELLEKPGLQAGDTMAEAARKTLLYHLQKMMQHEPGTREGEDPEELHDMRVATRRMRAALRVFEDYLAMDRYKPFLKVDARDRAGAGGGARPGCLHAQDASVHRVSA